MDGDSILEAMDCGAPSGVEQPTASTAVTDCWSEPVKVSDFVAKFEGNRYADESALVYRKLGEIDRQATLERWMCLDEETMNSLRHTMDPRNLLCGEEELDSQMFPNTDDWASLNYRRSDASGNVPWRAQALRIVRVGSFKVNLTLPKFPEPKSSPRPARTTNPIKGLEAVLIISYLLPSSTGPYLKNIIGQFACLGQSTLSSLVSRFKCDNDEVRPGDFCEEPFSRDTVKTMKQTLPGFALFIENVFYTNNWDYPNVIQEWATLNKVGQYEVKNIENVKFSEITVCLGKPYVYIHNGDCQHHVIVNDLRIHSSQRDDIDANHYPMLLASFVHNSVRTLCQLCGKRAAKWAVKDHPKLPHDPYFLCFGCNQHINYVGNVKKYDFKLFSYPDWGLI